MLSFLLSHRQELHSEKRTHRSELTMRQAHVTNGLVRSVLATLMGFSATVNGSDPMAACVSRKGRRTEGERGEKEGRENVRQ